MKIRNGKVLFFSLVIGVPSALFLGWDGYSRASYIDILMAILGLLVFLRVAQDAISQKSYDADMERLKREKTVRYATYGSMARVMPYIPAFFLALIFMAPVASDNPMLPYIYLGCAAVSTLLQLAVYLYGCHTMGLWKQDAAEEN